MQEELTREARLLVKHPLLMERELAQARQEIAALRRQLGDVKQRESNAAAALLASQLQAPVTRTRATG